MNFLKNNNPFQKAKGVINKLNPFKNLFKSDETNLNETQIKKLQSATGEMQSCLNNYKGTVEKTSGEMIGNTKDAVLGGINNMQGNLDQITSGIKEGVLSSKDQIVSDLKAAGEDLKTKTNEMQGIVENKSANALGAAVNTVNKAADKVSDTIEKIPPPDFEGAAETLGLVDESDKTSEIVQIGGSRTKSKGRTRRKTKSKTKSRSKSRSRKRSKTPMKSRPHFKYLYHTANDNKLMNENGTIHKTVRYDPLDGTNSIDYLGHMYTEHVSFPCCTKCKSKMTLCKKITGCGKESKYTCKSCNYEGNPSTKSFKCAPPNKKGGKKRRTRKRRTRKRRKSKKKQTRRRTKRR